MTAQPPTPSVTPEPTQQDLAEAARCWCDTRVSNREMDAFLAQVVAEAIARARLAGAAAEREHGFAEAIEEAALMVSNDFSNSEAIAAAIRSLAPEVKP